MLLLVQVAISGSSSLNYLTIIGHMCLMYQRISVRPTMSVVNMLQTIVILESYHWLLNVIRSQVRMSTEKVNNFPFFGSSSITLSLYNFWEIDKLDYNHDQSVDIADHIVNQM